MRLGITGVSSEYIQELKAALQTPWCVGILGGKIHHAIYYVGYRYVIIVSVDIAIFVNIYSLISANLMICAIYR